MKEIGVYIAASLLLSFTIGIGGGVLVLGDLPVYSHLDDPANPLEDMDVLDDTPNLTVTPPPQPWNEYAVTVRIIGGSNYQPAVQDAVTYWNTDGRAYDRNPVGFKLTPQNRNADITIYFTDDVHCGPDSPPDESTAGCAPIIETDDSDVVENPVLVQIKTGYTMESTRFIVIHELGHVLGLRHGEQPHEYMSHAKRLNER